MGVVQDSNKSRNMAYLSTRGNKAMGNRRKMAPLLSSIGKLYSKAIYYKEVSTIGVTIEPHLSRFRFPSYLLKIVKKEIVDK